MRSVRKSFIHGGKETPQKDGFSVWHSGSANVEQFDFLGSLENQCAALAGSFAFVADGSREISLVCDHIRSIPLFYTVNKKEIVIGDDAMEIARQCGAKMRKSSVEGFLAAGYVTEKDTLFSGVSGVGPGEIVTISKETGNVQKRNYFEMLYENSRETNVEQYLREMDMCYKEVFQDMIQRLQGRTAVLPLSGGCDSRTVAVMLKRLGYENVLCFSYGRAGNSESARSKLVAQALGFPWYFIEYNESAWGDFYYSQAYKEYLVHAERGVSEPCTQPVPAILQISRRYGGGVCIPGHALDFSAGSHLGSLQKRTYTRKEWIEYILKTHYNLNKRGVGVRETEKWTSGVPDVLTREDWVREYQKWEWKNRQSKFIANDVRAYEFSGYSWEMPFWDWRVCEFWRHVPYELLEGRKLQYLYMKKYIDPVARLDLDYETTGKMSSVKQALKHAVPFLMPLVHQYRSWRNYKGNAMAFYDWLTKEEYADAMKKYGAAFSINSIVANDVIHQLENEFVIEEN